MKSAREAGRVVGVLLLLQMLISATVNFALLEPIFRQPGYLLNAAAHPTTMALAAILGIVKGALPVGVAVTAFRVFRRDCQGLALWFLAIAAAGLALDVMESISEMSMLSLSQAYVKAGGSERDILNALRVTVASTRNWTHFSGLVLSGSGLFVFYLGLWRMALVPRLLPGLAVPAVLLQLIAVTMPFFGHGVVFPMLAPLGAVQLAAVVWMMAKGWRDAV